MMSAAAVARSFGSRARQVVAAGREAPWRVSTQHRRTSVLYSVRSACCEGSGPRCVADIFRSPDMTIMKATDTITLAEGYDAMRVFLKTVWRRHEKPIEEIAFVLAGLEWADGSPVDPTIWQDWLAAVEVSGAVGRGEITEGR